MSGTWVVIPAKDFARAKLRLRERLDDGARVRLAEEMLRGVVMAARGTPSVQRVLVVTDSDQVASLASDLGAGVVRDAGSGPALAVGLGLEAAAAGGARAAVVLLSDLPRVGPADVEAVVEALEDRSCVVAPDRAGHGLNALGLAPPKAMLPPLGSGRALREHVQLAAGLGLRLARVERPGLAFDVDDVDDLDALYALERQECQTPRVARRRRFAGR